ncbi:MAG: hypothetical protein QXM43_05815 [Desulfurococcaceae archaeon]
MAVATLLHPLDKHLRLDRIPTLYCPGCGLGIGLAAMLRALDKRIEEGTIEPDKVLWIGGISCSARMVFYINYDAAHVIHGRSIPFATGVVLAISIILPIFSNKTSSILLPANSSFDFSKTAAVGSITAATLSTRCFHL